MDHGVVGCKDVLFGQIKPPNDLAEFLLRNVRLVVHHAAVAKDNDLILRDKLRSFPCHLLFVKLRGHDKILKIEHGKAVPERLDAEPADELGRRFRYDEYAVSDAGKLLDKARGERRFAAGRSARQDDFFDAFHGKSFRSVLKRHKTVRIQYSTVISLFPP